MTLNDFLAQHSRLAIAFSGGLDSRFLCAAAQAEGCDVLAFHVRGPHIPGSDSTGARSFARTLGFRLEELQLDPLSVPEIACTDPLRCYYCKRFMLQNMKAHLARLGEQERTLCDGSNADDLSRYRPGLKALEEARVLSPLALTGWTKAMIRAKAGEMGFPLPAEAARPCLLTRYDYHLPVHRDELARIEPAENDLLALKDVEGRPLFEDLRLRLTPEPMLQVTHFAPEWQEAVDRVMTRHGFAPYTICETAAISGFYDRAKR